MGTRSLTYIYDNEVKEKATLKINCKPFTCIYIQYDGYLEGVGFELANLLANEYKENNGMPCLAGLLVCGLKENKPYNVYIYPPDLNMDAWQEYEYHVYKDVIKAFKVGSTVNHLIFEGSYLEFYNHCNALKLTKKAA
jgi:hypothetical protein